MGEARTSLLFVLGLIAALLVLQAGADATEAETSIPLSRALAQGRLALEQKPFGPYFRGDDGRWWLAHEYLAPTLAVPFVWLGDHLPLPPGPTRNDLVHLLQPLPGVLVTALIGLVLFLFASRRLQVDARTSMLAALLGVFATMVLPYARTNYDGSLAALFLLVALHLGTADGRRAAIVAGVFLGLACLSRASTFVAAVPVGLVVVFAQRERWLERLLLVAAGAVPAMVLLLALNEARMGSPFATAIARPEFAGNNALVGPFLTGFSGLLFSPGKGLLFHAPLVFVGLAGFLVARRRGLFLGVLSALVLLVLLHAKVRNWSGHWAWGPRYLIPALPLLAAGLAPVLAHRRGRWVVAAVAVPSLLVQLLPVLVSWTRRIVAGAGNQERAWQFEKTQLVSHARALGELAAGKCPHISTFDGSPCALDLWWLGYAQAHGTVWPLVSAAGLMVVAVSCLTLAFRATRRPA